MAASLQFILAISLLAALAGGCAGKQGAPQVPQGAVLVNPAAEGRGPIPYVAGDPGTAYIVDSQSGQVVLTVQMEATDQLVVHPAKDMVFFNGQLVREGVMNPKRTYQLYFLKS